MKHTILYKQEQARQEGKQNGKARSAGPIPSSQRHQQRFQEEKSENSYKR